MANIKSAKKRILVTETRTARNKAIKSEVKTMVKKVYAAIDSKDQEAAKAALEVCKAEKPILDGANASNYEAMVEVAKAAGVVLGVSGADINELYDTTAAIEKLGYKDLVLNTTGATIKETFSTTVQVRRACLAKNPDRTFGYPSIVNLCKIAPNDEPMQISLASVFVLKYGSIVVMDTMNYARALPLYGLDRKSVV